MTRQRILFFGNVQGVGFRYTTSSIARGFNVAGFVRNCPNHSVELVVEGEQGEIERFLDTLRDRMDGYIEREEVDAGPASGEFSGFGIR